MKILIIDNYDSFIYNILGSIQVALKKLRVKNFSIQLLKNDDELLLQDQGENFSHIILGPGPGNVYEPKDIGYSELILNKYLGKTSILGICLGHQLIIKNFGGEVIPTETVNHGVVSGIFFDKSDYIFRGIDGNYFQGMRYHSRAGKLKSDLELKVIGKTDSGEIMAVKHIKTQTRGVQFHPESFETKAGGQIFQNFITSYLLNGDTKFIKETISEHNKRYSQLTNKKI